MGHHRQLYLPGGRRYSPIMQPPGSVPPPVERPGRPRDGRSVRPRPPKSSSNIIPLMVMLGVGLVGGATCATCAQFSDLGTDRVFGGGGDRVGVVELVGPIATADPVARQIREFARRDDLVAIVLRIDSPGGAVAPSQDIYAALRRASAVKPVVASMGNMAASGGFWVSLGADWVLAAPGSITGSIGVITQTPDLRGLAELAKFRIRTFKSGPLKDAGNPFREMTDADRTLFETLIGDIYTQFITLTAERRGLALEDVRKVADGRILTGRAALRADLVDELGDLIAAAKKAVLLAQARTAKEDGQTVDTSTSAYADVEEPTLVYPKPPRPSLRDLFLESVTDAVAGGLSQGVERVIHRAESPVELR